jgi:hypothetical protein
VEAEQARHAGQRAFGEPDEPLAGAQCGETGLGAGDAARRVGAPQEDRPQPAQERAGEELPG